MDRAFIPAKAVGFSNLQTVIRWFIKLRWIACAGVFLTLTVFSVFLDISLPYTLLFVTGITLFLANLAYSIYFIKIKKRVLTDSEKKCFLHIQIISDYLLLLILVYFTGYLENPLIYYFVFHIMLTSFLFSGPVLILYTAIAISAITVLSLLQNFHLIPYYPLSGSFIASDYFNRLFFRTGGIASVLIICAYLISSIKERIDYKGKLCEVELNRYKSLDKVKSNFILQVTHELRGPLAAIMGYHEILLKGLAGPLEEKAMKTLDKANRRTENLLTMIGEMIDFAYMKSEQEVILDRKKIAPGDLIYENISLLKEFAAKKKITFTVNCSRNIKLVTNRDLFNMILGNLLTNSIRYSSENGVVSVTCEMEKKEIHLAVEDRGIGIEEKELGKIFDEFYRTSEARNMEKDGTGLGLAIVKRAVNSLQGRIEVFSRPGNGTGFHIYLPAA